MEDGYGQDLLDRLADRYGIDSEYHDIYGNRHIVGLETKKALLGAMGVTTGSPEDLQAALTACDERVWLRPCEPVLVRRQHEPGSWSVRMPLEAGQDGDVAFEWTVTDERNAQRTGRAEHHRPVEEVVVHGRRYVRFALPLPSGLELGYYTLTATAISPLHRVQASTRLIVVPPRCHPAPHDRNHGVWGLAVQLYALRSEENWGVGDFRDLLEWVQWAAHDLKAHIVGLNPLHTLKNTRPYHISPYSPDSRLYLNPLYISVTNVPEWSACAEAQALLADPTVSRQLEAFKKQETVDYEGVAAIKRRMLEFLFATFVRRHLKPQGRGKGPRTERGRAFEHYVAEEGVPLERFALFQALAERFGREVGHVWQEWPAAYHDPSSSTCREFLHEKRDRIRFHQYVQWVAQEQLARVAAHASACQMSVGLYHDLALGSDRSGSDAWVFQSVLALGADAGCPPDAFAPEGQNWGLPPVDPHKLRETGYAMFIDLIRHNLQYGGALRLDHVMALFRLFWIPRGMPGTAGAYVRYPTEDLLGILALESVRHRAIIVGEDLGTVPDFVRERLAEAGVLSYRVFYFERRPDGEWKAPAEYPQAALAVVTTHDLPTLAGFWAHTDIAVRARLGLYPNETAHHSAVEERERDKAGILRALRAEGLLPESDEGALSRQPMTPALCEAIHAYVARTPSHLMLATIEDLLGQPDQVNLPGTLDAYPNWSHKLPVTLTELRRGERAQRLAAALSRMRP